MIVRFKKLHPAAQTPKQSTPGSAGFDLVATSASWDTRHGTWKFGIGIAVEIPEGYVGLIFPRSSICKTVHRMANCVGVIDSDYRGEISAVFDTRNSTVWDYAPGDRVAQLVIVPVPKVDLIEVDELSETERGAGGYGSTGR